MTAALPAVDLQLSVRLDLEQMGRNLDATQLRTVFDGLERVAAAVTALRQATLPGPEGRSDGK